MISCNSRSRICVTSNAKVIIKTQAVIFDMDGVITDTMPYHFNVWKEIFHKNGIVVTHEDIYSREGQKGMESIREIFQAHKKHYNVEYAKQLLLEKEELFKITFKQRFIVGTRNLLKRLSKNRFKLALVTGTSRHEAKRLLPKELFDLFDVSICGCDVKNGKPHPEPYLKALNALLLASGDAVVIENAPFGIRSAKAAGLRCVAIATSLPRSYLYQADHIFSSIKELNEQITFKNDE